VKEFVEYSQKMETCKVHGLKELMLLKCPYYPKQFYRFNAITMEITTGFFTENREIISPKIHMKPQDSEQLKQS
jgi:hypothetical protein